MNITNVNDITVTAWWPYTAGETTPPAVKVKANQSAQKDFEGSDLIDFRVCKLRNDPESRHDGEAWKYPSELQ